MFKLILSGIAFTGVQALLYLYLWRRLVRDTQLPAPWRRRATWLLIGFGLTAYGVIMGSRFVSPVLGQTLGWPAFIWLATAFLLISFFGAVDFVRLLVRVAQRIRSRGQEEEAPDPSRRLFMNRALGGGVAVGAVTMSGAGTVQALKTPTSRRRWLPSPSSPLPTASSS